MENVWEALQIGRPQGIIILEVIVAMVLGGLIGIEREGASKAAGLRTHMLVAGAAALFGGLPA
jgi:putative Mg2+ transporter-C (MgtC) family protein